MNIERGSFSLVYQLFSNADYTSVSPFTFKALF